MCLDICLLTVYIFVLNLQELTIPRDAIVEFSVNLSKHSRSQLQKNSPVFEELMETSKFLLVIKNRKHLKIVMIYLC